MYFFGSENGNVMGSRGSVIPLFLKQNQTQNFFTVTDKNMTRFNITLEDSVKFVLKSINMMKEVKFLYQNAILKY